MNNQMKSASAKAIEKCGFYNPRLKPWVGEQDTRGFTQRKIYGGKAE